MLFDVGDERASAAVEREARRLGRSVDERDAEGALAALVARAGVGVGQGEERLQTLHADAWAAGEEKRAGAGRKGRVGGRSPWFLGHNQKAYTAAGLKRAGTAPVRSCPANPGTRYDEPELTSLGASVPPFRGPNYSS